MGSLEPQRSRRESWHKTLRGKHPLATHNPASWSPNGRYGMVCQPNSARFASTDSLRDGGADLRTNSERQPPLVATHTHTPLPDASKAATVWSVSQTSPRKKNLSMQSLIDGGGDVGDLEGG